MTHQHLRPDICDVCELWNPTTRQLAAGINWLADLIEQQQHHIDHKVDQLKELIVATQADIDALTQSVNTDRTAIATVVADLNALIAQGQPVQVADLQAAVDGLTADIAGDAPAPPA